MTRRMQSNNGSHVVSYHNVEHDEIDACQSYPPCKPVQTGGTAQCSESVWRPGLGEAPCGLKPGHVGVCLVRDELEAVQVAPAHDYEPPPSHYDGGNGLDVWAIWDAYDLDRYTAAAVKYICRAGKKSIAPRLDDLRKAANYIAKAIEFEEQKSGE